MPKAIIYILLVLLILALIPPALIARSRAVNTSQRRIHLIQDMDNQYKFRAQHPAPQLFADGRAMRPPVEGAIARGQLNDDEHFVRGVVRNASGQPEWAIDFPAQVQLGMDVMRHGQERFNIFCSPCHGASGHGDGVVNKRAMELLMTGTNGTTWVQPKSVHDADVREQPPGQLFNTITHGIRTMAGYESQIPIADRWAIVAYVKALQRSQHAQPDDVPADERSMLDVIKAPERPQPESPQEEPKP